MCKEFDTLILLLFGTVLLLNQTICLENTTAIQAPITTTAPPVLSRPRSLRLPNSTYPLHYYWHVTTTVHRGDLDFKANVTIDIEIKESTDEIVLHAKRLRNFVITCFDLETGTQLQDLTYTVDKRSNFIIIHALEYYQVFEVTKIYRLQILYEGTMNKNTTGVYWLAYQDQNNDTIYHAATQFEPTSARLALPCYDEPAFKANFTISITHGKIYNVISNMKAYSIIEHSDSDLSTTTFYTTPLISTYLVAFVVSNFDHISEEYRNVTHCLYTPPTSKNKGSKELKVAIRTVAIIEDYLGIPYALDKLDHVALNKNYGAAMENWGLITYKEDYLLYRDNSNAHGGVKEIMTIVHEISHQWFGNLVSPEWWSYAWLNEGFATYFAHIFIDLLLPEYKSMDYFLIQTAGRAYTRIEFIMMKSHPMTHYVETESDITNMFDGISYSKAACVIRMFHHAFNQKTFVRGIHLFLKKYQYSVANEINLFDSLQTALEEDRTFQNAEWVSSVRNIMASWTHSKWIPIVSVIRNYEDNTITIKQRSKNPADQEHWWIPLNFATTTYNDFNRTAVDYFMPPIQEVTLNLSYFGIELKADDWLVVNKQQTSFYHVLYDNANLRKIAKALQENHLVIHEFNRADFFHSLHHLIEHNDYSIDVIFELLKYLVNEDNLLVWNFVSPTVDLLENNLYGTASYQLFKQFGKHIIGPMCHKLILHAHASGKMTTDRLHTALLRLACKVGIPECLEYTRQLAFDYIFQNIGFQTETPDFFITKDTVLCSAFRYLSNEEFNAIIRVVSAGRDSAQFEDILYSLRCTQNEEQIRQYLDIVIGANSTQFVPNHSESVYYVCNLFHSNMVARKTIWQYISEHYESLVWSISFVDIFNKISEFVTIKGRNEFNELHHKIKTELLKTRGENYSSGLIDINSPKIGKKVKLSEIFLDKFGNDIYDWLLENQMPRTSYAIASVGAQQHNGGVQRHGNFVRLAENIFKNLLSSLF